MAYVALIGEGAEAEAAMSATGTITSRRWDFGDGQSSTEQKLA